MKALGDALSLRAAVLERFEAAASAHDDRERARLLTFVIAGGGPTGVEYAGALSELFAHLLPKDFPRLDFAPVRVVLVEGGTASARALPPAARRHGRLVLRRRGVEVVLGRTVVHADTGGITLDDGTRIDAATVIWTAGCARQLAR